jgi:hypothetical protein
MTDPASTLTNMLAAIVIGFVIFLAIYAVACALTGRKM